MGPLIYCVSNPILTILTIETIVGVGTIDVGLDENEFIESENAEEELAGPSSK